VYSVVTFTQVQIGLDGCWAVITDAGRKDVATARLRLRSLPSRRQFHTYDPKDVALVAQPCNRRVQPHATSPMVTAFQTVI
jgi:hypothetical protein